MPALGGSSLRTSTVRTMNKTKSLTLAVLLLSMGLGNSAAASSVVSSTMTVSNHGGGPGRQISEVVRLQQIRLARGETFWTAEHVYSGARRGGISRGHVWIDGRTCPALALEAGQLRAVVNQMWMQRPNGPIAVPFDGHATSIIVSDGPARGQKLLDPGTKLLSWWLGAKDRLRSCWVDAPVVVDGAPLPALMDEGLSSAAP